MYLSICIQQWVFSLTQSKEGKLPRYRVGPGAADICSVICGLGDSVLEADVMILHEQLQSPVREAERWPKLPALLRKGQVESKESKVWDVRLEIREAPNEKSNSQDNLLISSSSPLSPYVLATCCSPTHPLLNSLAQNSREKERLSCYLFDWSVFRFWWWYSSPDFKCASDLTLGKSRKELLLVICKLNQTEESQSLQMNVRKIS